MSSQHEFSKSEEQTIASLGQRMMIVAGLLIATGIGRIILGFARGTGTGGFGLAAVIFLLIALINIVMGVVFYRPTDNLKRIAATKGNDIKELMTAFGELRSGFNLLNMLLITVIVLALIHLILN